MHQSRTSRRELLTGALGIATVGALPGRSPMTREPGVRLRLALNAYSFDKPLRAGSMTLEEVIQFCAQHRVDALDATGYYFPGYPTVPPDSYINNLKRTAFLNGVQLSGTGVRNNFTDPDASVRNRDVQMVKAWIEVASKLGASVIRVFSGPPQPAIHDFDEVFKWMVPAYQECAEFGKKYGVILGLQQHNDFLKTADQTIQVMNAVNSPWFGDILDIGSLRQHDPYEEIERLVPYAVSWQIKENVGFGAKEVPTDLNRIKQIIDKVGYRGVLPFEALGTGDPRMKVAGFLEKIRTAFAL